MTWKNVETVGTLTGGANADFLAYRNGTQYEGKGGVDTFYADLSSWAEAVTWTNGKNATNSGLSNEIAHHPGRNSSSRGVRHGTPVAADRQRQRHHHAECYRHQRRVPAGGGQ